MNRCESNGSTGGAYASVTITEPAEANMHLLDLADAAILVSVLAVTAAILSFSAYHVTH